MKRKVSCITAVILAFCFMCSVNTYSETSFGAESSVNTDGGEVRHLFTHSLISYPEIAFADGNEMKRHFDRDCLTVNEFKQILQELYDRNYVLVSPRDVYETDGTGKAVKKHLEIEGKKLLILSFDDINYYSAKANLGMCDKLIVDGRGKLATYTKNAVEKINYDNETITILANFIEAHPDFSYNGAAGVICLTGFDGVLGYRTNRDSKTKESETNEVKKVVKALKEKGFEFACHSYGHYHMKKLNDERFIEDTDKWLAEVEPIIGKTEIYVYPYGEYEIVSGNSLSKKHTYLAEKGFKLFWGVGSKPFYGYLPFSKQIREKSLFMDRTPLDGYTLRHTDLSDYISDQAAVIDAFR